MSARLYMDEHVPRAITAGLRLRGVDVVTAQEDGRGGASDPALMDRATELGRALFTQDDDLLVEAQRRQADRIAFSGVIYGHQMHPTIGRCVRDLELIAEVPGMGKDDINLKIQGNYLEINGTRKAETPEGYTAHKAERGTASFSRSFTLPTDIDANKVDATIKNGILTLKMPKAEAAKPKQINVK